jgi:hypothetical protein
MSDPAIVPGISALLGSEISTSELGGASFTVLLIKDYLVAAVGVDGQSPIPVHDYN